MSRSTFSPLSHCLSSHYQKMNGYSKMRANTPNSKSLDFSNLNFSPSKTQQHPYDNNYNPPSNKPHQDEEFEGERFGVILSRNLSSASQRFRENCNNEKSNGIIGGAVKRAFSMRKSSSLVGDGYWRIHDTGDGEQVMIEEENEEEGKRTISRKNKRGRISRACKRFFKYF